MKRAAILVACGALTASCSVLVDPDGSRLDRFATVLDTGTRADLAVTDAPAAPDAGDDAPTPDAPSPDDIPDAPADDADAAIADVVIAADSPDAPPGDVVTSDAARAPATTGSSAPRTSATRPRAPACTGLTPPCAEVLN